VTRIFPAQRGRPLGVKILYQKAQLNVELTVLTLALGTATARSARRMPDRGPETRCRQSHSLNNRRCFLSLAVGVLGPIITPFFAFHTENKIGSNPPWAYGIAMIYEALRVNAEKSFSDTQFQYGDQ